MNVHTQYPKSLFYARKVVCTCIRCGVQEWAYVRGSSRPKLCSEHATPIKSAKKRAA